MRVSRMPTSQSQVATEYHSHYEIIDSDLHNYILSVDAKAWHHYLRGITVCQFCDSEATLTSSCCQRFSDFRQATAAAAGAKLHGQEDAKSKGGKSKGKKFSVFSEAERRTKDRFATRSVCVRHNVCYVIFLY